MNLKQAIGKDPRKLTDTELLESVLEMKRAYALSSKYLNKRYSYIDDKGNLKKTSLIESMEKRLAKPEVQAIINKKMFEYVKNEKGEYISGMRSLLSQGELRTLYATYNDYFTSDVRDKYTGQVIGKKENLTATVAGYKDFLRTQERVLGIEGFSDESKWTEKQRSDLWEIINKAKELSPELFTSKNYKSALGSEPNQQLIASYIVNTGITDPVLLIEKLKKDLGMQL